MDKVLKNYLIENNNKIGIVFKGRMLKVIWLTKEIQVLNLLGRDLQGIMLIKVSHDLHFLTFFKNKIS